MANVYVIGSGSTVFQKHPEATHAHLAQQAVTDAVRDAGQESAQVDGIWFGNCALQVFGQGNIKGQVVLQPVLGSVLTATAPIVNVEGGCATGTAALHGAFLAIASGQADSAMAVGVEKTWVPHDPMQSFSLFLQGIDQLDPERWQAFYRDAAAAVDERFEPIPQRVVFLDIHGLGARRHAKLFGTSAEQLAGIAAKNHNNGVLNPRAQYRFGATVQSVLDDKPVVAPFTRSMCAPISDGAAAVWLVSERHLAGLEPAVRERAIRVRTVTLGGGTWRGIDAPDVVSTTAQRAYQHAGITPDQVQVAEVHDCNAWRELTAYESLGFCEPGEGGAYFDSGATQRTGARPVNASGGLIAKGHPLGATGVGMVDELVRQLRGEAGEHQVPNAPTLALSQNAGGMVGFDEALCGIAVLER